MIKHAHDAQKVAPSTGSEAEKASATAFSFQSKLTDVAVFEEHLGKRVAPQSQCAHSEVSSNSRLKWPGYRETTSDSVVAGLLLRTSLNEKKGSPSIDCDWMPWCQAESALQNRLNVSSSAV